MTDTASSGTLVQIPAASLAALRQVLARDRSPAEAAEAARELGFLCGEGFHAALQGWLEQQPGGGTDPSELSADEFWPRLSAFFQSLGWGSLEFRQLHPGIASLTSEQWAEGAAVEGTRQPSCHFSTGMLADVLGRISGDELAVLEVECLSRGDRQCRFLLGGGEALGRLYEEMRAGEPFDAALQRLGG